MKKYAAENTSENYILKIVFSSRAVLKKIIFDMGLGLFF